MSFGTMQAGRQGFCRLGSIYEQQQLAVTQMSVSQSCSVSGVALWLCCGTARVSDGPLAATAGCTKQQMLTVVEDSLLSAGQCVQRASMGWGGGCVKVASKVTVTSDGASLWCWW
jgi:hypothetical protein